MKHRVTSLLLLALSVRAAEFQSGQAARAVIGQPSFSAHEAGIAATALSLANGKLYAADASHHVLTFDWTKVPGPKDDLSERAGPCSLCGFSASAQVDQPVLPGVAGVSVFGNAVAIVDSSNRRVLLWANSAVPHAVPIALGSGDLVNPISVAVDARHLFVGDAALHRVLVWNSLPVSDNQPPDAVLGQSNLATTSLTDTPDADMINRPAALVSDGTNLLVADNLDRRILVFTAADTPLPHNSVVNSASLIAGPLAPGTLVTITGAGLSEFSASAPDDGVDRLPSRLSGVEVFFDGVALPLLSVSPMQVRAQLPYDTANASAASLYVRTEHSDGTVTVTNATALKLIPANPGLFAFGGAEPRTGLILHTSSSAQQAGAPVTVDDPAKPGELLTFWAAGLGAVDSGSEKGPVMGMPYPEPDSPVVSVVGAVVSGRTAEVISATLPHGATGVYEVRILLPGDLPSDSKTELLLMQDGSVSNTITIPVQN